MTEHVSPTGGRRANAGKVPVELVPPSLVLAVARVLGRGAAKYAPRNWERGMEYTVAAASLERHLLAWKSGEDNDPESGEPHMAHVATNAAFLLEYAERVAAGTLPASLDDRPRREPIEPFKVPFDVIAEARKLLGPDNGRTLPVLRMLIPNSGA